MTRRSDAEHGWVDWPVGNEDYEDTGEGGLAVYAVWTSHPEVCITGTAGFIWGDCVVGQRFEAGDFERQQTVLGHKMANGEFFEHRGFHCTGFLYLGSTGKSWHNGEQYFVPFFEDGLTDECWEMIRALSENLYGQYPSIITCLDT